MKAAIYTRVSTAEQAREGNSLTAQRERLTEYANFQKYELLPVFEDDGYSGASMNRPALQKLIQAVKRKEVGTVLIYKLDRLSRRVRDVIDLVELFAEHGVTLFSLTENLDLSSPFGRAALKMSATFSELERETIRERMIMGKDVVVRQGKKLPTRVAPFGYRYDVQTQRFSIEESEANIVRKLFELYNTGNYNFRQLHDYAREAFGHPYFGEKNPLSCKPIIERMMYSGYILYKGEIYRGTNFEPIIDYKTFMQAQEIVRKHTTQRKSANRPYLLTGLVVCARCGNRYVGKLYDRNRLNKDGTKTTKYIYRAYGCAARVKRDKHYHPAKCDNDIIRAEDLEAYIEDKIKGLKFSEYSSGNFEEISDPLTLEIADLKKRSGKLLDLYLDGGVSKEDYTARRDEIERKIRKNEEIIKAEREKPVSPSTGIQTLKDQILHYDELDRTERQRLLSCLIEYISIDGNKIVVKWRVK